VHFEVNKSHLRQHFDSKTDTPKGMVAVPVLIGVWLRRGAAYDNLLLPCFCNINDQISTLLPIRMIAGVVL